MAQTVLIGSLIQSGSVPTTTLGGGVVSSSTQLPAGTISSSNQFNNLTSPFTGSFTGSHVGNFTGSILAPSVVSSSAQVQANLPAGTISASNQVVWSSVNYNSGIVSSSGQVQPLLPGGTVSSSTGTANYIPMWTGTVAQSTSVIYQSSGNVGISTTSPSYKLDVNGDTQLQASLGVGTTPSGTTGEIRATNNITAYYSDARLKTFLGTIPNALEKVHTLSGYYFVENEIAKSLGYNNNDRQVGVSAQEVQQVLPEAVAPAPISDEYLTVRYEKLVPLLIEAIKEQQVQIDNLTKQIALLQR